MNLVIAITGASSGFGALTSHELAKAGHVVYACLPDIQGINASQVKALKKFAKQKKVDLRPVELNVSSHESAEAVVRHIVSECGRLDVVIHNAGPVVFGPTEAFTTEQLAQLYDTNVLSTQRVNRAALPVLREQGKGLVIWVAGGEIPGGAPPYLGPYFAAKAGLDALAVSYASELARWNIETAIIIPGLLLSGVNDFVSSESPSDTSRLKQYTSGPTSGLAKQVMKGFECSVAADAVASQVARAIVKVIDMPFGTRPFRVHLDPAQNDVEIINGMPDRVRAEMLQTMGLADLLSPSSPPAIDIYS
ncbi:SDR family NAD(P)-dependent oxidoreductase [Granulicella mallensis]|uniref:NAD(P)-dependent dehydrogenase (Short-subunit alcohol dehydrogenase family) n=1 Tax=Granulicella mallensis TaxID=940614 RepID=A0A7W7ZSD9_9BACT|nr:SDR family NAD(P)-dependent oxidoreductase [Granulicella mallensis]MBB5064406.1 NAD(P)-dependent dehydrogenase (short-subunit alcohol dehydrogenase family) [Granulicella mallensis]